MSNQSWFCEKFGELYGMALRNLCLDEGEITGLKLKSESCYSLFDRSWNLGHHGLTPCAISQQDHGHGILTLLGSAAAGPENSKQLTQVKG